MSIGLTAPPTAPAPQASTPASSGTLTLEATTVTDAALCPGVVEDAVAAILAPTVDGPTPPSTTPETPPELDGEATEERATEDEESTALEATTEIDEDDPEPVAEASPTDMVEKVDKATDDTEVVDAASSVAAAEALAAVIEAVIEPAPTDEPAAVPQPVDPTPPAPQPAPLLGVPTFDLPARWARWDVAAPPADSLALLPRGVAAGAGLKILAAVQGTSLRAGQILEAAAWFPSRPDTWGGLTVRAVESLRTARSARRVMMRTARRTPDIVGARVRRYAWGRATTPIGPGVFQDLVTEPVEGGQRTTTFRCTVFSTIAPTALVLEFFSVGTGSSGDLERDVLRTLDSLR